MGFVNSEVKRRELMEPEFWEATLEYVDGSRTPLMYNSVVKPNANNTTAMVFISRWVFSKYEHNLTIKQGSKPKKQ